MSVAVMAVSGPPPTHHDDTTYLDFHHQPPSDSPYSPIPDTSSPESDSPSPGPVSPGKKRVRISDSTSVRLIEDRDVGRFRVGKDRQGRSSSSSSSNASSGSGHGFRPRALRFSNGSRSSDRSEKEALLEAGEYEEVEEGEVFGGRECGGDGGGVWRSGVEYREYTEVLCTLDQLAFPPQDLPPDSDSLESRDNPFLPGGDLSKEAEELLKKATIVRDKFYLQHEHDKLLHQADPLGSGPDPALELAHDVVDRAILSNASANSAEVLEERICPSALTQVEAAAPPQLRENGKAGEAVPSDTSPDRVRLEVGDSPTADGNPGVVVIDTDNEQQDRDKGRRRPKCCLLM